MSTALFEELGLSPNEAKIYQALILYGGSGVSTIALRSKVHRSNTYDAIHRLMEKGLVYEVLGQREVIYEPVDPVKFRELLSEKSRNLEKELPAMMKRYTKRLTPERAYVYKGIEGVKNYMRLALDVEEDIFTLGGKCAWLDPKLESFTDRFMQELKRKKINKYNLFDARVQEECSVSLLKKVSTKYKFLPKDHQTHSSIDIFGEYIVTFTGMDVCSMGDDMTVFVIASSDLADDYRAWWKMLWGIMPEPKKK